MSATSIFLATVLLASGPSIPIAENVVAESTMDVDWRSNLQTGSLLVSQGDCLAVKIFSQSKYTHVAAVVVEDGELIVYESANGDGVRKQSLEQYLKLQSSSTIDVLHPQKPFSDKQSEQFQAHLDEELGRPYAVRHHLTGEKVEGVHCAEYVIEALMKARVMKANNPARVSPATLAEGALKSGVYHPAIVVEVKPAPVPEADRSQLSWCERMWEDTKTCTTNCCVQLRRWILCR